MRRGPLQFVPNLHNPPHNPFRKTFLAVTPVESIDCSNHHRASTTFQTTSPREPGGGGPLPPHTEYPVPGTGRLAPPCYDGPQEPI